MHAAARGPGTRPVAVSAAMTGLTANTSYHFRISVTNGGGTSKGSDETFKTLQSCTPEGFCASFTAPANIEGSFKEPNAVASDSSGDIFVGDSGHNRVLEFNSKREYLRQFGSQGSGEGQFQGHRRHRHQRLGRCVRLEQPTACRSSPRPGPT